ncbi:hypothetical protein V6N11_001194 [Hibiscus sabdariffa]|uniref:RING-type domain-containing protein n=1 Tax=Hibiscus sabdariffa TaxID=183260 RepID=A0ABR2RZD7_9ROSI
MAVASVNDVFLPHVFTSQIDRERHPVPSSQLQVELTLKFTLLLRLVDLAHRKESRDQLESFDLLLSFSDYGMVPAQESSVREMVARVRGEDGDDDCTICLEGFEAGSYAARMPCSMQIFIIMFSIN